LINLTREVDDLVAGSIQKEQETIAASQGGFRRYLLGLFSAALLLSLLVAGLSIRHIARLERRSEEERRRIEEAEQELRSLSVKLVQAQEEERKAISRELHDEIGQMLTALRLELGNLVELREAPGPGFAERLAETKELAEKAMRLVRDLAMGIRPAMLDDLGLAPALQWQAREFARHNGIPAVVEIDGDLENLSEELRTCVYRVTQESLTNCARHARASSVRITVHGSNSHLALTVQDDGVGFDRSRILSRGLGLVGMEERVHKLGGEMRILSGANKGTLLEISVPLTREQTA
jgi:signal transduction histidine kinase